MWIQFGSELTILKIPTAQQHILPRKLFFVFQALIWLGLFNRILLITTWRCPLVTAHWRCVLFLPFTPTEGAPTYLPTYLTYCDDNSENLPTAAMEIENIKLYCGLKTSGYVWVRFRVPVRLKARNRNRPLVWTENRHQKVEERIRVSKYCIRWSELF